MLFRKCLNRITNIKQTGILLVFVLFTQAFFAQTQFYPLNYEMDLRLEKAIYNQNKIFSSVKPFNNAFQQIKDSTQTLLYIETLKAIYSKTFNDNLLEKESEVFSFRLNPVLDVAPSYSINESELKNNYRFGLYMDGSLGKKLGFMINAWYGIKSFPVFYKFQIDSVKSLPHFGKYFSKDGDNYKYGSITGYLSYTPYKFLNLNAGMGSHFIGDGYRSLFLSDNSPAYPYLKATVDVWKFKYLWMFGALSDRNYDLEGKKLRPKLLFIHYLSYDATDWLNLNFFESIVSNPTDSLNLTYINLSYLNPVIFFRPVEFSHGSVDNTLMGIGFKLKLFKKNQLYSQFIIDEFVFSEITSSDQWWGNKFGIQAGFKFFDLFGVENLFTRIEYNQVRPYTYSYYNSFANFGHRYQPLAHPMGANFVELIFEAHYHYKRFSAHTMLILGEAGMDAFGFSFGQDIYKPNSLRIADYGISQGQGLVNDYIDFYTKFAWIMNPKMNLSAFITVQYQKQLKFFEYLDDTFISFGISTNLFNDKQDYYR